MFIGSRRGGGPVGDWPTPVPPPPAGSVLWDLATAEAYGPDAGRSAAFTAGNYLSAGDHPGTRSVAGVEAYCGWIVVDDPAADQTIGGRWAGASLEKLISYTTFRGVNQFEYNVTSNGDGAGEGNYKFIGTGAPAVAGKGHWLYVVHDGPGGRIGIAVDGGPVLYEDFAGGIFAGSAPFVLGADPESPAANRLGGRMQRWYRLAPPTMGADDLYAAIVPRLFGDVAAYPDLAAGERSDWGVTSAWELGEASGARADAAGGVTLAEVGAVAAGPAATPLRAPADPAAATVRAWHRRLATRVGGWSLPAGAPAATAVRYPAGMLHAPSAPGFRRSGGCFAGTKWEFAARINSATEGEHELIRATGADGTIARLVYQADRRLSFRNTGPGGAGEVAATLPAPLLGQLAVAGGAVEDIGKHADWPDGPTRSRVTLDLASLGNLSPGDVADVVLTTSAGTALDGRHVLNAVYEGTDGSRLVTFVVAGTDHVGATITGGTVTPVAEYETPNHLHNGWVDSPTRQNLYVPVTIRRDGDTLSFRVGGIDAGQVTAPGLPPGPGAGSTVTVGSGDPGAIPGPSRLPDYIEFQPGHLDDLGRWGLDMRACFRSAGGAGYGGLPWHIDGEWIPGTLRRQSHLYHCVQVWTDGSDQLLDGPTVPELGAGYGLAYWDYAGDRLGSVDQEVPTAARCWVAVFRKDWAEDGSPLEPSYLGMAAVASGQRSPWARTIHADAAAPGGGTGTAASPYTLAEALADLTPGTRLRLRGTFGRLDLSNVAGPVALCRWDAGRPGFHQTGGNEAFAISGCADVVLDGLEALHTIPAGAYSRSFTINNSIGLTIADCTSTMPDPDASHMEGPYLYGLAWSVIVDGYAPAGPSPNASYKFYALNMMNRVSVRRCRWDNGPGESAHAIRTNSSDCTYFEGLKFPDAITGDSVAGASKRTSPRRGWFGLSDVGNRPLVIANHNEKTWYGQVSDPPGSRCAVEFVVARYVKAEGVSGCRITGCTGILEHMGYSYSGDQSHRPPYPVVIEGSRGANPFGGPITVDNPPALAVPLSGPRGNEANLTSLDTGRPLEVPEAVAIPGPAGFALAMLAGLVRGGNGAVTQRAVIDGVEVEAAPTPYVALPRSAGPFAARWRGWDSAGNVADGPAASGSVPSA